VASLHILLIDDHAMFRAGLRLLFGVAPPEAHIVEAGSIEEALSNTPAELDVVLLDIDLKGASGLEALQLIRRQ